MSTPRPFPPLQPLRPFPNLRETGQRVAQRVSDALQSRTNPTAGGRRRPPMPRRLPPDTALLGIGKDGLPILLDFSDPTPGAVLILSDDRSARREILREVLESGMHTNPPHRMQYLILSAQPERWWTWRSEGGYERHCLAIEPLEAEPCTRWLKSLAELVEQRRTGTQGGPAVLILIDDLEGVLGLGYDGLVQLDWLIKQGAEARVWVLATASATSTASLARWVRLFKTRILGWASDANAYSTLTLVEENLPTPEHREQFCVRLPEGWLVFELAGNPLPEISDTEE